MLFLKIDYICSPIHKFHAPFFSEAFDNNAGVVELVDTLDLGVRQIKVHKILKCGRGGIGRHARLRIWCREVWEFESPRPYKSRREIFGFFCLKSTLKKLRYNIGTTFCCFSLTHAKSHHLIFFNNVFYYSG